MTFLKVLGMVVASHVVLIIALILSPGCQSNPKNPAPSVDAPVQAGDTGTLSPTPVDENWSSPAATPAGVGAPVSANPVASTISSEPLFGGADSGRAAPSRPEHPEAYVSTGERPPAALNPPPTVHVVRAGDSLGKIAARYGTTVAALQKANPGVKPQSLQVGQQIKLPATAAAPAAASTPAGAAPAGARYTVKAGDSLSAIAARNGTTVTALRQANNLRSDTIQAGQQLLIPGVPGAAPTVSPSAGYEPPKPPPVRASGVISGDASVGGVEHTLKPGETLGALAKRYGTTVDQIMAANEITDPRKVRAGQRLRIPARGGVATAPAAPAPTAPAPAAPPPPPPVAPQPTQPAADFPSSFPPSELIDAPPIPVDDEPTPLP